MTLAGELSAQTLAWADRVEAEKALCARAEVLLADWLACVWGAPTDEPARPSGAMMLGAELSARSHWLDRDDVHWDALVHPGSVVWAAALAAAWQWPTSGRRVRAAAVAGYEVTVRVTRAFGRSHAARWHTTATSGVVGAAATAGIVAGLSPTQLAAALNHAVSVSGGLGQALVERSGTRIFHRSYAVTAGLLAVHSARRDLPATAAGFEGPRGAFAVLSDDPAPSWLTQPAPWALTGVGIRIYPTSGFFQSAVHAVYQLRTEHGPGIPDLVDVSVPRVVLDVSDPTGDDRWWHLGSAVQAAWFADDPQRLQDAPGGSVLPRVTVKARDTGMGEAEVVASWGGHAVSAHVEAPPGLTETDDALCAAKWNALGTGARSTRDTPHALRTARRLLTQRTVDAAEISRSVWGPAC